MAVYKFRVIFEEDTDVIRDIEIRSEQTFEDFHHAILKSINFQPNELASFYMSDDAWRKGQEIALMDMSDEADDPTAEKPLIMSKCELADHIDDPHQKFIYVFDFLKMWTFYCELIKIIPKEEPKATYPRCVKSEGAAPKQFKASNLPPVDEDEEDSVTRKKSDRGTFTDMGGIEEFGEDDDLEGEEGDEDHGGFGGTDEFISDDDQY